MNFFEHQDQAKKNTGRLVLLLSLAVISLVVMCTALIGGVLYYLNYANLSSAAKSQQQTLSIADHFTNIMSLDIVTIVAPLVIGVVLVGSLFKLIQLSKGGSAVAEAMGGKLINLNTNDFAEQKVLNVVQEMALASGIPVPPVYIIDDQSINAFAAGYQPKDAVIGVTRGCIDLLSRDELQGVMAHEFSHILHGDMKLNIRLVGILNGILMIGLIGYFLLRSAGYGSYGHHRSYSSSRSRGNNAGALLAIGAGLAIIGYAGTFFGNLIKAAVSRQREFLADASAVQFTRNPEGIAGALKKIGGYSYGSHVSASNASEFSHMYFGEGVKSAFSGLMATHPPLQDRIGRIEPNWNGNFPRVSANQKTHENTSSEEGISQASQMTSNFSGEMSSAATNTSTSSTNSSSIEYQASDSMNDSTPTASAIDSIGQPSIAHMDYAQQLLCMMSAKLKQAAAEPFSARALVYNLLIDSKPKVAELQWQSLKKGAHPVVFKLAQELEPEVKAMARGHYLSLLDLCLPALKQLSAPQYTVFKKNLAALIKADNRVDIFEWSLYRLITHNIEPQKSEKSNEKLHNLQAASRHLLSTLAYAGHNDDGDAAAAFASAASDMQLTYKDILPKGEIQLSALDYALKSLAKLKPLQKPILLRAMATCISHDGEVTPTEAELFRAIADSLNCPVPPLLPGQQLQ